MDTSDPLISFDAEGVCSHCHEWDEQWRRKLILERDWPSVFDSVKLFGRGAPYDAVIGLSGGADSSYAYHLAKVNGLRVLPMHFDNGYDLPVSTHNVECLVKHWGDELQTFKVNGPDFHALQVAFLKSGTTGLEIPTDHAIKAITYQTTQRLGVRVLINGTNLATESHGAAAWTQGHSDWKYIKSVGRAFGVRADSIPHYTPFDMVTWMKDIWWLNILDYTNYVRDEAISLMVEKYGYKPYGFKHGESRITRFLHGYIIPRRFGWDTRRSRAAAMVASGQMTRDAALALLASPPYPAEEVEEDKRIICNQLGISPPEFEEYMNLPLKHFRDYPSHQRDLSESGLYRLARWGYRRFMK